jgi:hypothetical protein
MNENPYRTPETEAALLKPAEEISKSIPIRQSLLTFVETILFGLSVTAATGSIVSPAFVLVVKLTDFAGWFDMPNEPPVWLLYLGTFVCVPVGCWAAFLFDKKNRRLRTQSWVTVPGVVVVGVVFVAILLVVFG